MEIKNWLEEFQKEYKIIYIYPDYISLKDSKEILRKLKIEKDYNNSRVWIEIGTWSIEEMSIILIFCKKYPQVNVLPYKEYGFTVYHYENRYSRTAKDYLYKTKEELINDSYNRNADACNIALQISEDQFIEFWEDFLQFCSEWKFIIQQ